MEYVFVNSIPLIALTGVQILETTRLHLAREKQLLEHITKIDQLQNEIDNLTSALRAEKMVTPTQSQPQKSQNKSFWGLW